jgi:hypothetical protein
MEVLYNMCDGTRDPCVHDENGEQPPPTDDHTTDSAMEGINTFGES